MLLLDVFRALFGQRLKGWAFWTVALVWISVDAGIALKDVGTMEPYMFDWDAYMEQAGALESGERNYSLVRGDTGPLVYGGGHALIHVALKRVFGWNHTAWTTELPTSLATKPPGYELRNVRPHGVIMNLQVLYVLIYIVTLCIMAGLVRLANVSWTWMPVMLFMLRTRNIYGMGLFNDCWAMLFAFAGVLVTASTEHWSLASALLSFGISVKMNVLLFLPGFIGLVWARQGWRGVLVQGAVGAVVQLLCGAWFLSVAPAAYIGAAFNLGREFTHCWSVNWRHVPEEQFGHPWFRAALLVGHVGVLVALAASQWQRLFGIVGHHSAASKRERAAAIVRALLLSNFVGIAFARSLHYQFMAWYGLTLPILLGTGLWHDALGVAIVALLEYGWNVHPPTPGSSLLVSVSHALILLGQLLAPSTVQDLSFRGDDIAARVRRVARDMLGVPVFESPTKTEQRERLH